MSHKEMTKSLKKLKKLAKQYSQESGIELYASSATIYLRCENGSLGFDIPLFDKPHIKAAKAWIRAHIKAKQEQINTNFQAA